MPQTLDCGPASTLLRFFQLAMRFRLAVMLVLVAGTALGQAPARITQAINLHQIVRLPGNTVWRAHAAVDQGAAPPDLRLEHMLLLLRRSPVQQ
ncbi:MAG: hypothetical protein ACRD1F_03370, partial [Terriglobales bacterium]